MTPEFHDHLATYFASRRWFAGKGREFSVSHIHAMSWLSEEQPKVRIEVVTVDFADGKQDNYQFPVAYLDEPDPGLVHALVGELDHPELGRVTAYDAVYLRPASALLLDGFLNRRTTEDLRFEVVEGAELPEANATGIVMTAEQSNTSIAFGEEAILKLFRRISAGCNPDIEIHDALTRHGSENVAPLLGWISGSWSDAEGRSSTGDLAMLQVFLRTATDGWTIALSSVRDLLVEEDLHADEVGGDFAGESQRLGEATAHVHANLADVFGTATLSPEQLRGLASTMGLRLDAAIAVVPELAAYSIGLRSRFHALEELETPIPVQRVHGDLHLGQTLRTVKGWKLIDFEGEPAKSLSERMAFDAALRDVAGMLRSFDYAAGVTLHEFGTSDHLRYRADEWSQRNREAFLEGYSTATKEDASSHPVLLRAYETDKAVYEAVYEARNRPAWLTIPMHAIARIAAEE